MVLALVSNPLTAGKLLGSAAKIALSLKKELSLLTLTTAKNAESMRRDMEELLKNNGTKNAKIMENCSKIENLAEICENSEASFLFVQQEDNSFSKIKKMLLACRDLRIPYLFFKDDFGQIDLSKIIVPVIFLEEEVEKAQFASAFGRFCQSEILLLEANDYGTKARKTTEKIAVFLEKFQLKYAVEKAKTDSYKVEKEAVTRAVNEGYGLVIVSASREYGLDDVIFGAKELHLLRKSPLPLLLVNPRGDLYALCD